MGFLGLFPSSYYTDSNLCNIKMVLNHVLFVSNISMMIDLQITMHYTSSKTILLIPVKFVI